MIPETVEIVGIEVGERHVRFVGVVLLRTGDVGLDVPLRRHGNAAAHILLDELVRVRVGDQLDARSRFEQHGMPTQCGAGEEIGGV